MPTSFLASLAVGRGLPSASWTRGVLVLGVVLLLSFTAKADQAREYEFDIPQQGVETALSTLATQAGALLLFPYDLVQPVDSKPVSGTYTVEDALAILLEGTGLTGGLTEGGVITISRAGAIDNQGRTIMAQNDKKLNGSKAPTKRRGLLGMLAVVFSAGVGAQDAVNVDEEELRIEEIIVTGTNIRGVENPTTPVLQFDKQDIEQSAASTVEGFLRTIPQNFNSLDSGTSLQSADPFNGNTNNTTNGAAVNLRGVGLGATLTLLNGRRMPSASGLSGTFVDVSSIPLNAIDRIDIQTDGASAVYGSDAVAGVINFVTRRDYDGLEANARFGFAEGGAEQYRLGLSAGQSWATGGGFVNINYDETNPLTNSDRDFIDTTVALPGGTLVNENESLNVLGSLNQEIAAQLAASIDLLFSSRTTTSARRDASGVLFTRDSEVDTVAMNSRIDYELSDSLGVTVFFDYAEEDSDLIDPELSTVIVDRSSVLFTVEGQISGALVDLPAGQVVFAAGGSYREDEIEDITRSERNSQRDISAVYAELLVPVVSESNEIPFVKSLDLSIAGRYEDYSDFGTTFNPKFGASWRISEDLSIRGSYSESFRAPPLANTAPINDTINIAAFPAFFFPGGDQLPQDSRLPAGTVAAMFVNGGSLLSEETAEVVSVGFDYEPRWFDGFKAQGSFFDIAYKDRIETVEVLDIISGTAFSELLAIDPDDGFVTAQLARESELGALFMNVLPFTPDAGDIQVLLGPLLTNLSSRDVSGIDLLASYDFQNSLGDFSTSLNLTHVLEYSAQLSENTDSIDQVGTLYRPSELRLRGSASYSRAGFTGFVAVNHVTDYQSVVDGTAVEQIDAWTTVDLSLSYTLGRLSKSEKLKNGRFAIGIQNVFDEDPPFIATPLDGLNFDTANANALGRVISLSATIPF